MPTLAAAPASGSAPAVLYSPQPLALAVSHHIQWQRYWRSTVVGAKSPNRLFKGSPRRRGEGLGEWVFKKAVQAQKETVKNHPG